MSALGERIPAAGGGGGGGVTDHGALTGLTDDDHPYVPEAGGTMTGALVLPGDPASALAAAPKQYVDARTGVRVAYGDSSGDKSTTSTSFAAIPGIASITVPAVAGDLLEITLVANWYVGSAGNGAVRLDCGAVAGREHYLDLASTRPGDHIVEEFVTVTSGMISGGNVVVAPMWAKVGTPTFFMENDTNRTLPTLRVKNSGPPLA